MPEPIITTLSQFGAAGLIGLLWLMERRQASRREKQIDEAHRRIMNRERELDALLQVVQENTKAINSLEHSQRRLIGVLSTRQPRERHPTG